MKKQNPFLKNISIYITCGTLVIGAIAGYTKLQVQADMTRANVTELKSEVKEISTEGDEEIKAIKAEAKDLEKKIEVNKTQQDNIQAQVQQVDNKLDQVVGFLLEIKQKKR